VNARLTSAAQADLRAALAWYRDRSVGLDREFLATFDAALGSVLEHPEIGAVAEGPIRRQLMQRFPYAIFYVAKPDEIVVIGCLHAARDPSTWRSRGAA
jgi:toxin ParE1/3/4